MFVPSKLFQASLKFSSSDKSLSLEWVLWIASGFTNENWKSVKINSVQNALAYFVQWRVRRGGELSAKCDKIAMIGSDIFMAPQHLP